MGSCYSGDHIAGDHIHVHTDITICNFADKKLWNRDTEK